MRLALISLLILIVIGLASATTTWDKDIYWNPSASSSWFDFLVDQTDIGYINMTSTSFGIRSEGSGEPDMNFTVHNSGNVTLNNWNQTFTNITVTADINMSVGGLDTGVPYFVVNSSGVNIWSDLNSSSGIVTFNLTSSGTYTLQYPGAPKEVGYSMFNSSYNYGYNQSIDFYCFPTHTNCVPMYENTTQYLFNYTNTEVGLRTVYLTLNESIQGYTIKAASSYNTSVATNLSTSRAGLGTVSPTEEFSIWFWIDTWYPFTSWYSTMKMEVA